MLTARPPWRTAGILLFATSRLLAAPSLVDPIAAHFEDIFAAARPGTETAAGDWPGRAAEAAAPRPVVVEAELAWSRRADYEEAEGGTASTFAALTASATLPRANGDRWQVLARVSSLEAGAFTPAGLEGLDPGRLDEFDLGALYTAEVHPRWDFFAGAVAVGRQGRNAVARSDLAAYGLAGARFVWRPNLSVLAGVTVGSESYVGNGAFPVFLLDWRIHPRHRLLIGQGLSYEYTLDRAGRQVLGTGVTVRALSVALEDLEGEEGAVGDLTFVAEQVSLDVFYRRQFANGLGLTVRVGFIPEQTHALYQRDDELLTMPLEASLGLGLSGSYRF